MRPVMARAATITFVGALMATTLTPVTAQVARPQAIQAATTVADGVTQVRWRGGYGGAVAGGIVAGAILGAGIAASRPYNYGPGPYYAPGYYYGPPPPVEYDDAVAYCMQRFKSYDPGSGTYLGYDGYRHPCP
jgi:hypothetical protein